MALNAEKCLYIGAGVPLGYNIDENKRFILNEDEAMIVRKVFEMYLNGKTMAYIVNDLNENQQKTSLENSYNKNSLRRILTNRRYLGIYIYKDTETPGDIPRIIDDDVFYPVQELMEKNKKAPARAKARGNALVIKNLYAKNILKIKLSPKQSIYLRLSILKNWLAP